MTDASPTIIENGTFRIPLYHGTCSLFVDSIQTFGLGGVNPVEKHDGIAFLKELLAAADEALGSDSDWNASRFAVQWMVEQVSFRDGSNFQHGSTYLAPSRSSAVGYALTNRFGSELLTQAYRVYQLLAERRPQSPSFSQLQRYPLVSMFALAPQPVLVTANDVPLAAVGSEGGRSPEAALDTLRGMWRWFEKGVLVNANFRLLRPLPPDSLSVEYLDPNVEHNPYAW